MPESSQAPVRYERVGAAALITIDRPERRNAVDGPTAAALHEAYLRFEADEDARVLVVTGAGELAFCAGADLKATRSMQGRLMSEEGPMGFTRLTPVQADDRRHLRLLPRGRASRSRCGATCGSRPTPPSWATPSGAGACR